MDDFPDRAPDAAPGARAPDPGWAAVDAYLEAALGGPDPVTARLLAANAAAGLPAEDVSPLQGRLLALLVRLAGARSVLEVGTLGGCSTVWLARGLPDDGVVVTCEADPAHAAAARANLAAAGLPQRVEVLVGPALDTLPGLADHPAAPFDVVFLDADKPSYPDYLRWAVRLGRPGALVVADNVVRGGRVADAGDPDPRVQGVRAFLAAAGADPGLEATAVQTVGRKGWDGFALALVRQGPGEEPGEGSGQVRGSTGRRDLLDRVLDEEAPPFAEGLRRLGE